MNDSISRQAAIVELRKMAVPLSQDPGCEDIIERDRILSIVIRMIRRLPPAIVKCKDCLLHGVCTYERGLGDNGFCSQGKRKEDED